MSSNSISQISTTQKLTSQLTDYKDKSEAELKELFSQKYFNGEEESIEDIEKKIKEVDNSIKEYEKQIKSIQTTIDTWQKQIEDKANELKGVIGQINDGVDEARKSQQEKINKAIELAVAETKRQNSGGTTQTNFKNEFMIALGNLGDDGVSLNLEGLYNQQGAISSFIDKISGDITFAIKNYSIASTNMKQAVSVKSGLEMVKGKLETQVANASYSNSNTDNKIPIFSYEKETVVAGLADKYGALNIGNQETTGKENQGKDTTAINNIKTQLQAYKNQSVGSKDSYGYSKDNKVMAGLEKALFGDDPAGKKEVQEGSLIWQLAEAGASNSEIMDIIADCFGAVHIVKNNDGSFNIPYGHSGDMDSGGTRRARTIFDAVRSIANNTAGLPQPEPIPAPDSKLVDNAVDALGTMIKGGFSFKESMYALDQLFPGLDIGYLLNEQPDSKNGIVRLPANSGYDKLANAINEQINKGGDGWKNAKVSRTPDPGESKPIKNKPTDPISVKDGNKSVYFVNDANNNNQYDGVTDLVGADGDGDGTGGIEEFKKLYGGLAGADGKITGDALKNIMVMVITEETDPKTGAVTMKQGFMSAADAGMTEIDLNSITDGGNAHDINGSTVEHTFNVTMNGKTMTAEQTLEDNDYLDATLNNAGLQKAMTVQLSDEEVNSMFTNIAAKLEASCPGITAIMSDLDNKLPALKALIEAAKSKPKVTLDDLKQELKEDRNNAELYAEIADFGNKIYGDEAGYYNHAAMGMDVEHFYDYAGGKGLHTLIQEKVAEKFKEEFTSLGYTDGQANTFLQNIADNLETMVLQKVAQDQEQGQ